MTRWPVSLILVLGSASGCAGPESTSPPTIDGDLALVGVTLLDPAAEKPMAGATLVVEGDRIVAVGSRDTIALADGIKTVDGAGLYVLPGLWDLHVHLRALGDFAPRLLVTQGVLGVRDLGGEPEKIEAIRGRIERGELLGPRVVRVGPTLNGAPNAPFHRVIEDAQAARQAVAELKAAGVDLLKTHNATSREGYFALIEAAREAGMTVAGHVPTTVSPLEACEAGQASIEHIATLFEGTYIASFGSELEAFQAMPKWVENELDALVACFAKHGTMFVPTLRAYEHRAERAAWFDDPPPSTRYLPADLLKQWRESSPLTPMDRLEQVITLRRSLVEVGQEVVRRLHEAGALVGAGTDIGGPGLVPGVDLHDELRLFVEAGLTPREALATATRGPGANAGGDSKQGRLVVGASADVVLLRANAFESLDALDQIESVVLRGRYLDRASLDRELSALGGHD